MPVSSALASIKGGEKPLASKGMLFVYWFVGNSHEMDVSLVSTTPLVNGVLNLENQYR